MQTLPRARSPRQTWRGSWEILWPGRPLSEPLLQRCSHPWLVSPRAGEWLCEGRRPQPRLRREDQHSGGEAPQACWGKHCSQAPSLPTHASLRRRRANANMVSAGLRPPLPTGFLRNYGHHRHPGHRHRQAPTRAAGSRGGAGSPSRGFPVVRRGHRDRDNHGPGGTCRCGVSWGTRVAQANTPLL